MRPMSPMKMYQQARPQGEELVLAHLGLVKRVALHLKARVPAFMELDELIQVGMMGLLEASRVFDASKGVDFAAKKPEDLLRIQQSLDHNETLHALSSELGRAPTQAEMAEHMGKDLDDFQKERGKARRFETYSLEVVTEEVMSIADDSSRQPDVMVEEAEFMQAVTEAIGQLPEREQLVMQLYYVEELNLKEIGEVLEVSESRISQILSSVVKKLRGELQVSQEQVAKPSRRNA